MISSEDSICPGCMKHMLNLITGICEACGDDYSGMSVTLIRGMRELAKKSGPLRDQLTIKVALDTARYPSGCVCGHPKLDPPKPHADNCPASSHADRYMAHLIDQPEAKPQESKPADAFTQEDVAFVAGLRSRLRDSEGFGDEDVRTQCPECGKPLTPAGDNRAECKPCGVSLIVDVSAAIDFTKELHALEVWHCAACDACFAFRQIPIMNATVLAGDDEVPITCFQCSKPLEQWVVMRPLVGKIESGPADLVDMLKNKATATAVDLPPINIEGSDGGPLPGEPGNSNKRRDQMN